MDVVRTLSWFDKWFARHHHKCGVARLDMSILERGAGETKVKLTCPMCGNVISGTFQDEDMQHVDALLSDAKRN